MKSTLPSAPGNVQGSSNGSVAVSLQERKQQMVRAAIWDAAIDLIARNGFAETTVDEIAQAAGTSRRTFFRYFESKSDLMAQTIVSYGTSLTEAIASCPNECSPAEMLRHVVLRVARQSESFPQTRKVMEIVVKYPAAREAQIARVAEVQDRVAAAFAQRFENDAQGQLTAQMLAGLTLTVLGVIFRFWYEHGEQDVAATAEKVFSTLGDVAADVGAKRRSGVKPGGIRGGQKRG